MYIFSVVSMLHIVFCLFCNHYFIAVPDDYFHLWINKTLKSKRGLSSHLTRQNNIISKGMRCLLSGGSVSAENIDTDTFIDKSSIHVLRSDVSFYYYKYNIKFTVDIRFYI